MGTTKTPVQTTTVETGDLDSPVRRAGFATPVMELQRTAGNRVVQGILQQERVQRTPTRVDAPVAPEAATGGSAAPTFEQVKSLDAIDKLSEAQIAALDVKTSDVPYRVIHDVFAQSWHVVKAELLKAGATKEVTATRRALMKKLLDYREWHHQAVLEEVRKDLEKQTPGALLASKGAGSETLTSDIDVNLKGSRTEMAVAAFNTAFKNPTTPALASQVWDFEPGVVYDVNVYAIDFMHKYGALEQDGHRVTKKEGARTAADVGGVKDPARAAADRRAQLAVSLFKARVFMTAAEFDKYRADSLRGLAEKERHELGVAFALSEIHFKGYLAEMAAQMNAKAEVAIDKAESGVKQLQQRAAAIVPAKEGEDEHATGAKRENAVMEASNRIYERKLQKIASLRGYLASLIKDLGRAENADKAKQDAIEAKIDTLLAVIRRAVAEASMYANEASMTDATIHHGVVGIQGGLEIDQQKHEGLDAVNEHLADIHKEAARYEGWEGAYKAGKYMMRLADAARNMGFGYIYGVQQLYDAGRKISVDIKGRADKDPDVKTAAESEQAVKTFVGVNSMQALLDLARQVGAQVTQEYMQERTAEAGPGGKGDTATGFGHRTGKKGEANAQVLNKDMVHPADRAKDGKAADASEMETAQRAGKLDDFRFRLTPEELEALQNKWAAKK
jgi:hypothetical protein